jgi:hypothetical protein
MVVIPEVIVLIVKCGGGMLFRDERHAYVWKRFAGSICFVLFWSPESAGDAEQLLEWGDVEAF